jgi:endoglucanase Acf2
MLQKYLLTATVMVAGLTVSANVVTVGSASYLDAFPGTDSSGRNSYPSGTPYLSGAVANLPIPTNDWWTSELTKAHGDNIFNYPMAIKPVDAGLTLIKNMQMQAITAENPIIVGLEGLNCAETTVCNYSDWGVTFRWTDSSNAMEAIVAMGVPMAYFTRTSGSAQVKVTLIGGAITINGNIAVVTGCYNGSSYALYAPTGCTWQADGLTLTCDLGSKDYWSVALLPDNTSDAVAKANEWAKYAFAFPSNTKAEYTVSGSSVTTNFNVYADLKESGAHSLMGILPHQYNNAVTGQDFTGDYYETVRGRLKMFDGSSYTTNLTFKGFLPTLPGAQTTASGYSQSEFESLVDAVCNNTGYSDWTDSYNDGQLLNRLVVTARAARESGDTDGFNTAFSLVKSRLERWLNATTDNVAFMFYYHKPWTTMLAYPAGHSLDSNINDHHFQYGYYINAAAFVAEFDKTWASKWGEMVNMIVRDFANIDRNDTMFPYLRNFCPYAGHSWANGLSTDGLGNDQESSSEAMNSHSAIIQWAAVTGNTDLLNAAIWMYTTEMSAIQCYWFDTRGEIRPSSFTSAMASRVFGNSYDDNNYWGGGIAASYGINIYPVQTSSKYLVDDVTYANKLWNAMKSETGILNNEVNANIWYDSWIQYLAMISPSDALSLYNSSTQLGSKFGISQAFTYQWVHALAAIGTPDSTIYSDYPFTTTFRNGDTETYAVYNYSSEPTTVTFSDGFTMTAAANSLTTVNSNSPDDSTTTPGNNGDTDNGDNNGSDNGDTDNGDNNGSDNGNTDSGVTSGACSTIDNSSTEGTFNGDYTISYYTNGNSVTVTAKFAGTYQDFAGPWFFNESNGFQELSMTKGSDDSYTLTINDLEIGSTLKFRIKIAFAGGLAVTKYIEYRVGSSCGTAEVELVNTANIKLSPNPANDIVELNLGDATNAQVSFFNVSGRCMLNQTVNNQISHINIASLNPGLYLVYVQMNDKASVLRLIKK